MDKLLEEYSKKTGAVPSNQVEILLTIEESYDPQTDKGNTNSTEETPGQVVDSYDQM